MSTYTQIMYQIVFATKGRYPGLVKPGREVLFKFMYGILENKKCHVYRIDGVEDHVHILTSIHPTISLSQLMNILKSESASFANQKRLFPFKLIWQEGYGAFTYSIKAKNRLIEYIKNQEEHHRKRNFKEEYIDLLSEHGVIYDEKYLL